MYVYISLNRRHDAFLRVRNLSVDSFLDRKLQSFLTGEFQLGLLQSLKNTKLQLVITFQQNRATARVKHVGACTYSPEDNDVINISYAYRPGPLRTDFVRV